MVTIGSSSINQCCNPRGRHRPRAGLGARWWIENDLPYSPKEMDQLYRRLTEPGIRAGLRPKA
jgi:hypothetical protein